MALEQPSRVSLVSLVSTAEDLLKAFFLIRIPTQGAEMVGPALATAALLDVGPAAALPACGGFHLLAVLQASRIAVTRQTVASPSGRSAGAWAGPCDRRRSPSQVSSARPGNCRRRFARR